MTQSRPANSTKFTDLFSFSSADVARAFKHARKVTSISGFTLLYTPADTPPLHGKLLIITPRVAGKAHDRNKIRRRVKNIYYQHNLFSVPGVFILLVYRQAMNLSYEQLKEFLITSITNTQTH